MADEEHGYRVTVGDGPDYKVLFLGACSLVVVLGGSAFGVWTTSADRADKYSEQSIYRIEQRVADTEHRLTELAQQLAESRYDRGQLHKQADDQEGRIRAIERVMK